jgi:DNA-3-methyladenine glycosylase
MIIPVNYFLNDDVLFIAEDLIGKYLFTLIDGQISGGIITETEAYKGTNDRASHAFGGKHTSRNEIMYAEGGVVYIYLCYGIHYLLNFVTNKATIPDAVLIRSIFPTHGEELMLKRSGKNQITPDIGNGPGKVTKLLGITLAENGIAIPSDKIWLEDRELSINKENIQKTSRIGVSYAKEDALLPYRFVLPDNFITQKVNL